MRSCPYSFRGSRSRERNRCRPRKKKLEMPSTTLRPPSHTAAAGKNKLEPPTAKPLTKRARPMQMRVRETGSGCFVSCFGSNGGGAIMRFRFVSCVISVARIASSNETKLSHGWRGRAWQTLGTLSYNQGNSTERPAVRSSDWLDGWRCIIDGFDKLGLNPDGVRHLRSVR